MKMQPRSLLPRPTAILKDWDGTIVDSLARVHAVHNQVLTEMGFAEVDFATTIRMTGYGPLGAAKVLGISLDDNHKLARRFDELFFIFDPQNLHLMPGAAEFMSAIVIDSTVALAVVSNKRGDILRQEIAHLGWQSHIGSVVAIGEASENKPSPAPALAALQQLGVAPSKSVWFIGDTPSDIECALAAGLTAILISDHPYTGPQPCYHFSDMYGLLAACSENNVLNAA